MNVEKGAGSGCKFADQHYINSGAKIVTTDQAWAESDIIIKYKAPIEEEYKYFRPGLNICALFHAESNKLLIENMCKNGISAYAFEFLRTKDGIFPMAKPGGEIAGKVAVLMAAHLLQSQFGGKGKLLTGVREATPCVIGVIGYGNVGSAAIKLASDLGNNVICFGTNVAKMNKLSINYNNNVKFVKSCKENYIKYLPNIDVLIGSVLISTYDTPALIDEHMIHLMEKGSVVVDVTCGYGSGYMPFIDRYTTLKEPSYIKDGLIFCKIDNLPSAYPITTVEAYTKNAFPYICKIFEYISGIKGHEVLVDTCKIINKGKICHPVIEKHMKFYEN